MDRKGFLGTDELYFALKMIAVLVVILLILAGVSKYLFSLF